VTEEFDLPKLPPAKVILVARATDPERKRILSVLVAFLKASAK